MRAAIRTFLTYILTVTSCLAGQTVEVQTTGRFKAAKGTPTILDLRLERVVISDVKMEKALFLLADGIASATHGKVHFSILTENSRDYMDRIPKRDPKIHFEGTDVYLRQVVDSLCRQAGWSYAKVPPGYLFTDSDRFFRENATR